MIDTQSYLTDITASAAEELLKNHEFIRTILAVSPLDESYDGSLEEFLAIAKGPESPNVHSENIKPVPSQPPYPLPARRFLMPEDSGAPWWKKMLSAPPRDVNAANGGPSHDPAYLADDSGGKGTTIYILDDGFDLDNAVSQLRLRGTHINSSRNLLLQIALWILLLRPML
jgi:hypothetical protein